MQRGSRLCFLAHVFFCDGCDATPEQERWIAKRWDLCETGKKLLSWAELEDASEDAKNWNTAEKD